MFRRLAEVAQNRYVGVAVVGSLAGVLLLLFFLIVRGQRDTVVLQVQPLEDSSVIRVYVGGEVAQPGLYSLPRGSRMFDGINAAGGITASADTSSMGLASPLKDADQVIVPARPEPTSTTPAFPSTGNETSATLPSPPVAPPLATEMPTQASRNGIVNINTATAAELEDLPEIGPVLAERIVQYRLANGPFQTVEELARISGISERMVEDLRPLIGLGS